MDALGSLGLKSLSRLYNRLVQFKPDGKAAGVDYYKYGDDDKYPNLLEALIHENGTARRAWRKRSQYIKSKGFQDDKDNTFSLGGYNGEQLLSMTASGMAAFRGIAWLIERSLSGEILKVIPTKHAYLRRAKNNGYFLFNKGFGTKQYRPAETDIYPPFIRKDVTPQDIGRLLEFQKKNKSGKIYEVLYLYTENFISTEYPVPDWSGEELDLKTGIELRGLDLDTARNGFMPSAILTIVGKYDDKVKDNNGKSQKDRLFDKLRTFTGLTKNEDGSSGRSKLLVLNAATQDDKPQLDTFDQEKIISGSIEKREANDRQAARAFGVHPVLLGFSDASVLGNQQAISNASAELANDVEDDQSLIERAFRMVFGAGEDGKRFKLTRFVPLNHISDKLLDSLTAEEKRELTGRGPLPVDENVTSKALSQVSPLVATKILDRMTDNEIRKIGGLPAHEGGDEIPPRKTDNTSTPPNGIV